MTDGLLVIDKPPGITSHGVVAVVRRTMGTRKVGHAGTLDPMATGVLVVGVNRATRLLGHLMLHDKEYTATIRLGSTTVTDDREGEVTAIAEPALVDAVSEEQIRSGMIRFVGDIEQVPTAVSAIKVDGKRAYDLVRAGEQVALSARSVHVERFDLLDMRSGAGWIDLDVHVACSTGTYVRALARDLGACLGVGGHLTSLRRTRVGAFDEGEATRLQDFEQAANPSALIVPLADVARRSFACLELDAEQAHWVRNGRRLPNASVSSSALAPWALMHEGELLALAEPGTSSVRYLAVFA